MNNTMLEKLRQNTRRKSRRKKSREETLRVEILFVHTAILSLLINYLNVVKNLLREREAWHRDRITRLQMPLHHRNVDLIIVLSLIRYHHILLLLDDHLLLSWCCRARFHLAFLSAGLCFVFRSVGAITFGRAFGSLILEKPVKQETSILRYLQQSLLILA